MATAPTATTSTNRTIGAGAPISGSIVGRAVDNALRRAGMDAPVRGANLLRH